MIYFLENTEHWENTEMELATRGVTTLFLYFKRLAFMNSGELPNIYINDNVQKFTR